MGEAAMSQESFDTAHSASPLRLIPPPKRVEMGDGVVAVPHGVDVEGAKRAMRDPVSACEREPWRGLVLASVSGGWCGGSALDAQSYEIVIDPARRDGPPVVLRAPTIAGLRHAWGTLAQLLRQFPRALPAMRIVDAPAIAARGVMLDVSRNRIPTMDEFARILDDLALLKVNHLQLYTEHTFAYAGHEDVWRGCSPIMPEEVRTLDGWCRDRGIELAANQNCFGHLKRWLDLPAYRHLAETHGEWMFDVWPRSGAFSLCPTDPASIAFVSDLLSQLLPCFSSGLVNIGCDETYDIGFGRSKAEVERRGKAAVCAEFVAQVAAIARDQGKRSMFWADIALSHPEVLAALPRDIVPLAWGYEGDSPFAEWGRVLRAWAETRGVEGAEAAPFWLCPGTSSWRSIFGRTSERHANITGAVNAAIAHGAHGVLMCDWGDTGHHQQWPIAMMGLAHGASAAWSGRGELDASAATLQMLNDGAGALGPWLEKLGDADVHLREKCLGLSRPGLSGRLRNQGALFIDMMTAWEKHADVGTLEDWEAAVGRIEILSATAPRTGDPQIDREIAHTLGVAKFAGRRAITRRARTAFAARPIPELRAWVARLADEHAALWRLRSREGGLGESLAYYEAIARDLENADGK